MLLRRSLAIVLWLGAVAVGCGSPSPENPNIQQNPSAPKPGALNIVHASPDAPAIDVYVDGMKAVSGLSYRKGSGNVDTPSGAHKVEVRAAGAAAMDAPLWSNYLLVQEGQKILLAAVGRAAESTGPTKFTLLAEPFGTTEAGKVRLRLLHASPSAPQLDVAAGSEPLWKGAAFGRVSQSVAVSTKGDLTGPLSLSVAGAADSLATATLPGTYAAGSLFTAIVFGETNPLSSDAQFLGVSLLDEQSGQLKDIELAINNMGPKAAFYVFHASPDAPAIDLFVENGARLAGGLAFKQASPLLELVAGPYKVDARIAGMPTTLASTNLKLLPGLQWAILVAGLAKNAPAGKGLAFIAAPKAQKGESTLWRVIHAVPDVGTLDLKDNGPVLFAGLNYLQVPQYLQKDLPVATVQLSLRDMPTKLWNIVIPQTMDKTKGEVTTIYLTGSGPSTAQPVSAMALVESSATPMQAPTLIPLMTTMM